MRMVQRLHEAIAAVCPIASVSIKGKPPKVDKIDYLPAATETEKSAALAAGEAFDWSSQAENEWLDNKNLERKELRAKLQASISENQVAITDNQAFLDLPNPNAVAIGQQVRRLTSQAIQDRRQMNMVLRRLVQLD